jgi:hypothetical protein
LLIREIDADRQVHQRSGTVEGGIGGVVAGTGEWNDRKAAMGNLTGMKELEYGVPQDPTGDRLPGRRDPGRRIALIKPAPARRHQQGPSNCCSRTLSKEHQNIKAVFMMRPDGRSLAEQRFQERQESPRYR